VTKHPEARSYGNRSPFVPAALHCRPSAQGLPQKEWPSAGPAGHTSCTRFPVLHPLPSGCLLFLLLYSPGMSPLHSILPLLSASSRLPEGSQERRRRHIPCQQESLAVQPDGTAKSGKNAPLLSRKSDRSFLF